MDIRQLRDYMLDYDVPQYAVDILEGNMLTFMLGEWIQYCKPPGIAACYDLNHVIVLPSQRYLDDRSRKPILHIPIAKFKLQIFLKVQFC